MGSGNAERTLYERDNSEADAPGGEKRKYMCAHGLFRRLSSVPKAPAG